MFGPHELLAPPPQRCRVSEEALALPRHIAYSPLPEEAAAPLERLDRALRRVGSELSSASTTQEPFLRCESGAEGLPAQGYRLRVGPSGIDIAARDRPGLHYAISTLAQWCRLHECRAAPSLGALEIEDAPDIENRGVMLDISRNKVPRLETLFDLVDLLASWKINQLQLYTEHTFEYRGHEAVWRHASPLTPDDIRALDAHCRARCIELVPNQNSLGHMHRWLVHEPYRQLAECPEGIEHPFSKVREPFSLCPTDPGSLALLDDLYAQLLPCFTSDLFNVGLDETFDLGKGRSGEPCGELGGARVYLDFLRAVHQRVEAHGRRMMFWGDVILDHPELVSELPTRAVALLWGYEATHPFAEQAAILAASPLDFYLCPGTSSWRSFSGRWRNAVLNLGAGATAAHDHGALGYLITDWGDNGHLQVLPISYAGFLAGACFAWRIQSARAPLELPLARLLDLHAFDDLSLGAVTEALGNAYLKSDAELLNGTALFHLLMSADSPFSDRGLDKLDPKALARTAESLQAQLELLRELSPTGAEDTRVRDELTWTAEALLLACDLGRERLARPEAGLAELGRDTRVALAQRVEGLVERRRELWLARNRPGGMEDSLALLGNLLELLEL